MALPTEPSHREADPALDFHRYSATYLDDAWKPDRFAITSAAVTPDGMELHLSVLDHPGRGVRPFHLSNLAASLWLQQMGVVYARWRQHDEHKAGVVDMLEFSLRCRRPVRDTDHIVLRGTLERCRPMRRGLLFTTGFDVQDGSYVGRSTFIYLPEGAA
jgi:hypothetical protein